MKKRFIYFHNNLWNLEGLGLEVGGGMVQWLGPPLLLWGKIRQVQTCRAPPPFMRENSTSSDLSNSTYKSLTNRYQYRFVSDYYEFIDLFSIYYRFYFGLFQTRQWTGVKAVYEYKIVYKPVIYVSSAIFLIKNGYISIISKYYRFIWKHAY